MIIGVPKEIKEGEYRVALTPAGAEALVSEGHSVRVQKGAGEASGFSDSEYRKAGAAILPHPSAAWSADLILKVKEPLPVEFHHLHSGQILFTFLHLAPNPKLVDALLKRSVTAIGYETVEEADHRLPLLEPMSEIAGRVAALIGAYYQANPQGGRGVLFGGMPGVLPAHVVILGGGTVGENAARVASGMGSRVTILERRQERMRYLDEILGPNVSTLMADANSIRTSVASADILIGAIHVPGARTPQLVSRALVKKMKPLSVIVDVAIDQGGSCETSRPTSHFKPTYVAEGVLHYCVSNMPGAYARTSTLALTNLTLPYAMKIARLGLPKVFQESPALAKGAQCHQGRLTCAAVATSQNRPASPLLR